MIQLNVEFYGRLSESEIVKYILVAHILKGQQFKKINVPRFVFDLIYNPKY